MANKLPSGKYRTAVYTGTDAAGKRQYRYFIADSADEADFAALDFKLHRPKDVPTNKKTLRQAAEEYLTINSSLLSVSTIYTYRTYLKNHFQALFDTPLDKITKNQIQAEVNNLAAKLMPKSVKNAYGFISTVLNANDIKYNIKLPRKQKIIYKTPSPEQLQKIFQATQGQEIEIPVLLAAWLSLRLSEVRGLKWSDISEDSITVNRAKVCVDNIDHLKVPKTTSSKRIIPLSPYLKTKLAEAKATSTNEFVTTLSMGAIEKQWRRALERNNIPYCRFHDLRHANASVMLMLQVPDKYAMERGGWSNYKTIKDIYQQTYATEADKYAQIINEYFAKLTPS